MKRLERALASEKPDRVPFLPAIYEHKAWFIGETPSAVSRSPRLLASALLAEFEQVRPDALTVGIDVYNVEAEAVGCPVIYYEGSDTSVPAVGPEGAVFQGTEDVASLHMPDPEKDGRMPLNLEVAAATVKALGAHVPVRGAVSGPFSLAAHLAGPENFFMLTMTHPGLVQDLIHFSSEAIKRYGRAFIERGCGVVIFDSHASPDLLSPQMYREFVLAPTKGIVEYFQGLGIRHVPLIIGGNTTKMLTEYIETGANNLLCDAKADARVFLERCSAVRRAFRRNIDSTDFLEAAPETVRRRVIEDCRLSAGYAGFILGTAVLPYGTPLAILTAIRETLEHPDEFAVSDQ